MVLLQGLCYVVDITMVFLTFIGINLTLLYFSFIITLTTGNRAALNQRSLRLHVPARSSIHFISQQIQLQVVYSYSNRFLQLHITVISISSKPNQIILIRSYILPLFLSVQNLIKLFDDIQLLIFGSAGYTRWLTGKYRQSRRYPQVNSYRCGFVTKEYRQSRRYPQEFLANKG